MHRSRRAAPFGNDLQDDFDVKLIAGKVVYVSKSLKDSYTKPSCSKDMELKDNVTAISSQHTPNSPKKVLKLPPIQLHKSKFHSAPPKLHCPTAQLVIQPAMPNKSHDGTSSISDPLFTFTNQLNTLQMKRPHTLEDIKRSCTRLDDLRNGTISVQELVDVLYVNGISVSMETLKEFVEHNKLTINGDSEQVLYKHFVDQIAKGNINTSSGTIVPTSTNICEPTHEQDCSKSSSSFLHRDSDTKDNALYSNIRTAPMSCPERQDTTTTMLGSYDSIIEDDVDVDDVSLLLSNLQSSFSGTRWGSHSNVQRLESALAKADKHNTGCLPAVVVCGVCFRCPLVRMWYI